MGPVGVYCRDQTLTFGSCASRCQRSSSTHRESVYNADGHRRCPTCFRPGKAATSVSPQGRDKTRRAETEIAWLLMGRASGDTLNFACPSQGWLPVCTLLSSVEESCARGEAEGSGMHVDFCTVCLAGRVSASPSRAAAHTRLRIRQRRKGRAAHFLTVGLGCTSKTSLPIPPSSRPSPHPLYQAV